MWLRKTSVVFLNAQDYMGGNLPLARKVLGKIEITIPMKKSQRTRIIWHYMGGAAGSGQYRLISRPPLGIICNHRPATFVCFIPPSSNDHNTMYMMLFISCLLFVCSLFNESESPLFALDGVALTSLWMRIKRAFHFQSNDVNPSPPLPGMVHKSANLCPTDTVFKIQTNNDKEC